MIKWLKARPQQPRWFYLVLLISGSFIRDLPFWPKVGMALAIALVASFFMPKCYQRAGITHCMRPRYHEGLHKNIYGGEWSA
jgi:hypothetical protein